MIQPDIYPSLYRANTVIGLAVTESESAKIEMLEAIHQAEPSDELKAAFLRTIASSVEVARVRREAQVRVAQELISQ